MKARDAGAPRDETTCPITDGTVTRDPRTWIRRPDRQFWLDLLKAPPKPTEIDAVRRARIARGALGLATIVTLLYAISSALVAFDAVFPVIVINVLSAMAYGVGMWMASLGRPARARMILVVTLNAHLAAILWYTGDMLSIGVYAFVAAALAAALFSEEERLLRVLFLVVPIVLLVLSITVVTGPRVDFFSLPPGLLLLMRVLNTVFAVYAIFLLIALFEREVLRSEAGLVVERERSDRLLHAVLPRKIADELRDSERMIADRHPEVTVLFADIAGFTPWASQREPEEVISLLERIFSRFDRLVSVAGAEKIKTIGDAYMVISGAPDPRDDHAHVIARLALAMGDEVAAVRAETGIPVDVRIGINTGPVIAGVIGAVRFSYDVWGDTVNTASRMESHGEAGRVQVSAETHALLADEFAFERRGVIDVKGKGAMETFWLTGFRATDPTDDR